MNWSRDGGAEGSNPVGYGGGGANVSMYSCKGIVPMVMGNLTTKSNDIPEGITWKSIVYVTLIMLQFPEKFEILQCTLEFEIKVLVSLLISGKEIPGVRRP